jgi:putative N6-adenine-specific DNA methylase
MSQFFVSCPIGFENELVKEMKSFWFEMIDLDGLPTRAEFPEIEVLFGGIEFHVADHLGFQLNFFSKIASRVLLRIAKFEARYFDQFEKSFAKVEWNKYFTTDQVKLKAESHKSRINNEKNIIEAATNALTKNKFKVSSESPNSVFIRIEKDRVTISLDTSGEHLHRRGYATHRGDAPLRETLAACMLKKLMNYTDINSDLTLIDPFTGSGTLLFEASSYRLPNLERDYSWLHFKNAPKLFQSASWKKNYRWFESKNTAHCLGYDNDVKAISNFEKNKEDYNKTFNQAFSDITVSLQDSRDLKLNSTNLQKNIWVVANPPYGIRLADDNAKEALINLEEQVDGIVVIHPKDWRFSFRILKPVLSEEFSNQGLNLKLSVFKKN